MSPLLSLATRFVHPALEVPPISRAQALVWAATIVVALPIAIQHGPIGFVVLVVASTVCGAGLWFGLRRTQRVPRAPICLSVVVGALALFPLALWTQYSHLDDVVIAKATPQVPGAAALAAELRPLLYFDHSELFPPVDLDDAEIAVCRDTLTADCADAKAVCPRGLALLTLEAKCDSIVDRLDKLKGDYVKVIATALDPGQKPGGPTSAIYHHVFKAGTTLYVDYWWYFAHNPAPVARSVLCGDALTRGWLGAACAEHPADWEGITLVLVPAPCRDGSHVKLWSPDDNSCVTHRRKTYEISEAHYAQHEKVVSYPWQTLQRRWHQKDMARWTEGAGHRPLVFVALSSHASYAAPCGNRLLCKQIVHDGVSERRDGGLSWTNNHECGEDCLKMIPTGELGEPSAWNSFRWRWGNQHCILFGSYCDTQRAPMAPAFQPRYQDPCPADHCMAADSRF